MNELKVRSLTNMISNLKRIFKYETFIGKTIYEIIWQELMKMVI